MSKEEKKRCDYGVRLYLDPNSPKNCIERSNLPLKPYQELAAKYLQQHDRLLIVYGTGLGKTLTSVAISQCFLDKNPTSKVYWLTPPSIYKQRIVGQELSKYKYIKKSENYECYSYWNSALDELNIEPNSLVICDEVHTLRNKNTIQFKRVYKFIKNAKKRVLLTATPLVNKYGDVGSLMDLLFHTPSYEVPYIVSTTEDFKFQLGHLTNRVAYETQKLSDKKEVFVPIKMSKEYTQRYSFELKNLQVYGTNSFLNASRQASNIIWKNIYQRLGLNKSIIEAQLLDYIHRNIFGGKTLGDLIKKFLKSKLEYPLPDSQITQLLTQIQKRLQKTKTGDLSTIMTLSIEDLPKKINNTNVTANIVKEMLNEVFNPAKIPNSSYVSKTIIEKKETIKELVNKYKNKKIIIYTNYIQSGLVQIEKILTEMGQKKGINFNSVYGGIKGRTRRNIVNTFNDKDNPLNCLIITRALSEGLTFLNVQALIIVEPPWSYARLQQIIGRTIRLNSHNDLPPSERVVNVYKLVLVNTDFKGTIKNTLDLQSVIKKDKKTQVSGDLILYSIIRQKMFRHNLLFKYLAENSINKYYKIHKKFPPYNPNLPFLKFTPESKLLESKEVELPTASPPVLPVVTPSQEGSVILKILGGKIIDIDEFMKM